MYSTLKMSKILKNAISIRFMSIQASAKLRNNDKILEGGLSENTEWLKAKPYNTIPGPSKWGVMLNYMPGGKYNGLTLFELHQKLNEEYGSLVRVPGNMGRADVVFAYNPDDFEKVYRTEGVWPIRKGLETFEYYRKVIRPDIFKNLLGLVNEQGEAWGNMRTKVNPVLMKPQTVKHHLSDIDEIAIDFIERVRKVRDPTTKNLPINFTDEIHKWAFESVCLIALDKKFDLLKSEEPDQNVKKLVNAMKSFFQLTYEFDVLPSFWKYYETSKFKKLIQTYDDITNLITSYIEDAVIRADINQNENKTSKGVLDQLLKIDRQVAVVMAMDMLMAGIDTTSSAFIGLLYRLAINPDKQEKLREEIFEILPTKDAPLTKDNTTNMPYLRACIKESLRMVPITPGNIRRTNQNLVLSGYQVPKGIDVLMAVMMSSNDEKYFSKFDKFIPERWLKDTQKGCPHLKSNNPFTYLPFGFGSRTCIGKRLAEMEIETIVSRIIRNYRVSWYSNKELKYTSNVIISPESNLYFKFEDI